MIFLDSNFIEDLILLSIMTQLNDLTEIRSFKVGVPKQANSHYYTLLNLPYNQESTPEGPLRGHFIIFIIFIIEVHHYEKKAERVTRSSLILAISGDHTVYVETAATEHVWTKGRTEGSLCDFWDRSIVAPNRKCKIKT